jgi:hypothetical protein
MPALALPQVVCLTQKAHAVQVVCSRPDIFERLCHESGGKWLALRRSCFNFNKTC